MRAPALIAKCFFPLLSLIACSVGSAIEIMTVIGDQVGAAVWCRRKKEVSPVMSVGGEPHQLTMMRDHIINKQRSMTALSSHFCADPFASRQHHPEDKRLSGYDRLALVRKLIFIKP
jgi:hypothetical protein|uniref:Secreted protein n=1 Tax=Bionectria ochroleuca TaxID=29856 RepID=A0A8H7NAT7_BIOOC